MSDEMDMTLRLERLIPMEPDRLFVLWTEPAQLAKWWAPEGYEPTVHVLDSRPGGRWRVKLLRYVTRKRMAYDVACSPLASFRASTTIRSP